MGIVKCKTEACPNYDALWIHNCKSFNLTDYTECPDFTHLEGKLCQCPQGSVCEFFKLDEDEDEICLYGKI